MKRLVGQRNPVVLRSFKEAILVLECFVFITGSRSTSLIFDGYCSKCNTPVKAVLSEDVDTCEIWLEGPDVCGCCGNQLYSPDAPQVTLSQKQIEGFFGKF